jgi:oligopeptide/dipeptide ABC transporter ATP-binding protein
VSAPLLEIERLTVTLPISGTPRPVIHDVSLTIGAGEALGLVGESGSGKSMTLRSVMRLLPPGAELGGDVRFDGRSIGALSTAELRAFRARDVAVVFQDPRAHINPMRSIGDFLTEGLVTTGGMRAADAERRVRGLLEDVGIADAARRLRQRPHELSGGLLQRVMIAAALATEPRLILADEPTTALDVTTQEEVMAILDEQRRERGLAMLFITHDLELASAVCDRIAVMYAGSIVDDQSAADLHRHAAHPYTVALLAARPGLGARGERLKTVEGRPLSAFEAPEGCAFAPRCPRAEDRCRAERPALRPVGAGRAACHFAESIAAASAAEVLDA